VNKAKQRHKISEKSRHLKSLVNQMIGALLNDTYHSSIKWLGHY